MVDLIAILICLSFCLSAWTIGFRTISREGMVLFPLANYLESFGKKKKEKIKVLIDKCNKEIKKTQSGQYSEKMALKVQNLETRIERLNHFTFKLNWWHKPIISCAPCMCNLHGLLVASYFYCLLHDIRIVHILPFSMMLSVVINTFVMKRI